MVFRHGASAESRLDDLSECSSCKCSSQEAGVKEYLHMVTSVYPVPFFEQTLIENIKDGYWLDTVDINSDGRPDLVASGLELGQLVWYENPGWHKHLMATLPERVAWDYSDIQWHGMVDVVIWHEF